MCAPSAATPIISHAQTLMLSRACGRSKRSRGWAHSPCQVVKQLPDVHYEAALVDPRGSEEGGEEGTGPRRHLLLGGARGHSLQLHSSPKAAILRQLAAHETHYSTETSCTEE